MFEIHGGWNLEVGCHTNDQGTADVVLQEGIFRGSAQLYYRKESSRLS